MSDNTLHCTANVSKGPDKPFEQDVFKLNLIMNIHVQHRLTMTPEKDPFMFPSFLGECTPVSIHPSLKELPKTVLGKDKHDGGLIQGTELVVITLTVILILG